MTQDAGFWMAIDELVGKSQIIIDRPKGSRHPKFKNITYMVDYGYLQNTASMDGAGIDVWVGTRGDMNADAILCIVDLYKRDSEMKILIGCTKEEKETIYRFHNESEYMKGIFIHR